MTRCIISLRFILLLTACAGLPGISLSAGPANRPLHGENHLQVLAQDGQGLDLALGFGVLESFVVATPAGLFTELRLPGCTWRPQVGAPKLPVLRRFLRVPLGCRPEVRVTGGDSESFALGDLGAGHPLMPTQASHSKSPDAATPPFTLDAAAYAAGRLESLPAVRLVELGLLRGARLVAVEVDPVQWDSAGSLLRVHNNLSLRVDFCGADEEATRALAARTRSPHFDALTAQEVLNPAEPGRDCVTEYPITMVVVAPPAFAGQLQPFIQWKTRKGFRVVTGYLGDPEVGSTRTTIKSWLQGLYDAATPESPAPSFLLLVGDTNLMPTWTSGLGGHSMDLNYVTLAGDDHLPDVLCGRFSARDSTQLQNILDKTLEYEQYLMPDPFYLGRSLLVAGVDPEYSVPYINGQVNYATAQYFNTAHGIDPDVYLYPQSAESWVAAAVVADASAGQGFINYSGHGSTTSWLDPLFSVSQVNSLAANRQYATVVGNCCQSNSFQLSTCFGEVWLRAVDKGAIGYLGASADSYWEEDYWWSVGAGPIVEEGPPYEETGPGVYDGLFHDHGEAFADWHATQGAMLLKGSLAVAEAGSIYSDYYWEIYNLLGDPSLSTWTSVPGLNPVTAPDTLFAGQASLTLSAEPWSYAGLSAGGVLKAGGLVDGSGTLTLCYTPFTASGAADLVVTHQRKQPVMRSLAVSLPDLVAPVVHLSPWSNGRMLLSWQAVPYALAYRVWSAPAPGQPWALEATTPATSLQLDGQQQGSWGIYRVTAVTE